MENLCFGNTNLRFSPLCLDSEHVDRIYAQSVSLYKLTECAIPTTNTQKAPKNMTQTDANCAQLFEIPFF